MTMTGQHNSVDQRVILGLVVTMAITALTEILNFKKSYLLNFLVLGTVIQNLRAENQIFPYIIFIFLPILTPGGSAASDGSTTCPVITMPLEITSVEE
jgi:hypothetical protein